MSHREVVRPARMFQSLAAPEDGCDPHQPAWGARDRRAAVSILSRPGGRLRRSGPSRSRERRSSFNPQPPRRTAATRVEMDGGRDRSFNPQPPRRTAATPFPSPGSRLPPCFNPQPPRRTAATRLPSRALRSPAGFNPQPPRRTAATHGGLPPFSVRCFNPSRPGGRLRPGCRAAASPRTGCFNP